jgi:phosphate transport system protein
MIGGIKELDMRDLFQEELVAINNDISQMAELVGKAINKATESLLFADREIAERVIESDVLLNDLASALDERCTTLTAKQQPVATELRSILGSMRIASSMERMGDLAVHVAKSARLRYPARAVPDELVETFRTLGHLAEELTVQLSRLVTNPDITLAQDIQKADDKVDALHRELFRIVLSPDWSHGVEAAVDVTLLSRYYERFADHAVSVARRIIHVLTGEPYIDTVLH